MRPIAEARTRDRRDPSPRAPLWRPPASADAAPPPPADLHVLGGDGWRDRDRFDLRWTNARERIRRSRPSTIWSATRWGQPWSGPWSSPGPRQEIDGIRVPELARRLHGRGLARGRQRGRGAGRRPPSSASTRRRPAQVAPLEPSGWLEPHRAPLRDPHRPPGRPAAASRASAATRSRSTARRRRAPAPRRSAAPTPRPTCAAASTKTR